jgi:rhodanese-related sulfurtransferase
MDMPTMDKMDLRNKLESGEQIVVVDARSEDDWQKSDVKLPGAIRISPDKLDDITLVGDANAVTVYCACPDNAMSEKVAKRLMTAGRLTVSILDGGFDAWQAIDFPLENKSAEEKAEAPGN